MGADMKTAENLYTPGPWRLLEGSGCRQIVADHEIGICDTVGLFDDGEDEANARLIAAAPDLLAACKLALAAFEYNHVIDWGVVEQAISKAETTL